MKRVIALELVGLKKLDCDLFDENGKTVYIKGTEFTPEIYMALSHSQVYRMDNAKLCESPPKAEPEKKQEEKNIQREKKATKQEEQAETAPKDYREAKEDYDKEVAALNRKFFNELNGKNLSPKEKEHFNELYKKSVVAIKRKHFNEIYEEDERKRFTETYEPEIKPETGKGKTPADTEEEKIRFLSPDMEKAFEDIKKIEPYNNPNNAEYKSVIELEKQDALIKEVKQVLYCAINSAPMDIGPCVRATETILNEVYNKIRNVNNMGELRIHDYYTFSHDLNVALISALIGREIGYTEAKVKDLTFSAFLHDVGKMKIPKEILYKSGKLTEDEMNLVKEHTQLGYDFLVNVLKLPVALARPALEHHERWEGQGYPQGLKGEDISEFAQIVAIADVYDALVSHKVYKESKEISVALKILLTEEKSSFNPKIIDKFVYMAMRS